MATELESVVSFRTKVSSASGPVVAQQEVTISAYDYKEAEEKKISLAQLYCNKYPTIPGEALAFDQFCASAGLRVRADHESGVAATSMHEILHGDRLASDIRRGDGADRQTPAGRILFPEVMLQLINQNLLESKEDYLQPWESAIALRSTVASNRVDQPLINVTAPEASEAQPIAQGAEPAVMVGISLADRTYTIPTKSIGLKITDEALRAATIDLVALALTSQARGERIRRVEADMAAIFSGDVDRGITAISAANASTFDSAIPGVKFTQRAWVKWLRANYTKMSVSHVFCDIDAALDIEGRTGRPVVTTDSTSQPNRINVEYSVENLGIPEPRLILLPTAIVGADTVFGMDSRYGLHEITNASASYSAVEAFVLRRTQAMRFDYGVALFKLYDEAFTGVVLGA